MALILIDRLTQTRLALATASDETRLEILEDMEACAHLLKLTLQPLVAREEARLRPAGDAFPRILN